MTEISAFAHLGASGAAMAAGFVNAIAGGGTLISFPLLTLIGVPAVRANATSSVALLPGYLGGSYAQRNDLSGLGRTMRPQLIASAVGGFTGAVLLRVTSEAAFRQVVPFLILAACLLLAAQDRLRQRLFADGDGHADHRVAQTAAVGFAAIYGGYFGAGLGIMFMAILGLFSTLAINRLNAVKQMLSVAASTASVAFLVFSGKVEWSLVAVMAPAALVGGSLGGRVASRIPPKKLRMVVITFGFAAAIVYLVKSL